MWGLIRGGGRKGDQPKATKANLGEASAMYYDEEKKKWRERGKEHLEEEEKELAPPPMSKPKEEEGNSNPQPPKPELTGVDALIAPPNPYMNRLGGNKGGAKPPAPPLGAHPEPAGAESEPPAGPPSNPFGAPMPAAGANPFGPRSLAATQPFNPNAPRGIASSPNPNDPSDAPAEGGAAPANPFGQRNHAAGQPFNPNAPRSVAGGPGPNPNGPRARRQAQAKPRPPAAARSPFAAATSGGGAPPELGGGDPEGGDDELVGRYEQPKEAPAVSRRAPPAALTAEEEPDNSAAPPVVPASPFGSHMPAYSPLSAPARTVVAPGLPPLHPRMGPFAANGPGGEGMPLEAPPQDAEGAGQEPTGLGEAGVAGEAPTGQEPTVLAPPLASLQEQVPAPAEAAAAEAAAAEPEATAPPASATTTEPEVSLLAEMATEEAEVAQSGVADASLAAQSLTQADPFMTGPGELSTALAEAPAEAFAEVPEELAGPSAPVEPAAAVAESSAWGDDLGELLGGVAELPMPGAPAQEAAEVAPAAEIAPVAAQPVEQPSTAPQDAGWDIELEGFEDKPSAPNASEGTTTAVEAEQPVKEAGGARELTLSNGESTSSWVLLTGEAQADTLVATALSAAASNGPDTSAQKVEETAEEPGPGPVAEVVAAREPATPAVFQVSDVAQEAKLAEAAKKEEVDALFAAADVKPPAPEVAQEPAVEAVTLPSVAANGPDFVDLAGEEPALSSQEVLAVPPGSMSKSPEAPVVPEVAAVPTLPDSLNWFATPAPVPANESAQGGEVSSMEGTATAPAGTEPAGSVPAVVPDSLDSWSTTPPAPEPTKGSDLAEVFSMDTAEAPGAAVALDSVDGWFSEPAAAPEEPAPQEVQAPPPTTAEPVVQEVQEPLLAPAEPARREVRAPPELALHEPRAPLFAAGELAPRELQEPTLGAGEPATQEVQAPVPAAQEAELAELRTWAAELERQLAELRHQAAAREEELQAAQCQERAQRERAEAALAEAKGQLEAECSQVSAPVRAEGDEEFNLPDFVWSCGNSEVMAFVQKIVGENASLRRQVALAPVPAPALPPVASPPFAARGATAESAAAFAGGVGADDGHQIPSLLALLDEHANDLKVCSQVCTALETLTFTLPEHRQAVASGGGAKAIMEVLEQHQDAEAALLRPCMDALWNLTFEDEAVESTSEARGVERVAALMKKHAGEPELLGPACAVLLNLAVREQNRWKMVDCGCVALVANAMQQHAQNEELLELGCQALYMLAYHQDLKPLVLAAKGGDAAALAASCPRSAGRAQKWGRWLQEVLAC